MSALAVPADAVAAVVSPLLAGRTGEVDVWVQLQDSSLGAAHADATAAGLPMTKEAQRSHLGHLRDRHDELSRAAASLGGRELARVSKAHNAIALSIDARNLGALAAQPGVLTIRPVLDYTVSLAETVPYIGATALHKTGLKGNGVRIAVLDSGIDYTHFDLGGSGTAADYTRAYGTTLGDERNRTIPAGLFPTAKVVGGFDFVGEFWPTGDSTGFCGFNANNTPRVCLRPDPNPIACGSIRLDPPSQANCDGTHGTHVADIAGGRSEDETHEGVAPGSALYAVKVCSSVSAACSGVALLQAMDFSLDPNGDGDVSDAVDVINMSLGSNYGQREDDLTEASQVATRVGVVVVAAAGNAADRPYIVSSPSIAPGAISVAQTHVPSAAFFPLVINAPAAIAGTFKNTATVTWAPINNGFVNQSVAFVGRGCPADSIAPGSPADAYLANPSGKVALIDRGACNVSLKVDRAAKAGAVGVLIGLVAAGDAVSFSLGGGDTFVPTLVIIQADSNRIKARLSAGDAVSVTVKDSSPLVGSMVGSSARGPSVSFQTIKPEIGAPGASVSAVAGLGTARSGFGGTSGATPMVAGSAALLLEAFPQASPAEIKARLMNTAQTSILTAPNLFDNQQAPSTRIGGGEVRVDRALSTTTLAFVPDDQTAALSFGAAGVSETREFHKKFIVFNASNRQRRYTLSTSFRDTAVQATAAATLRVPSSIVVPARGSKQVNVHLTIDPARLSTWALNGGSQGGNGQTLNRMELDGHVTISDATDTIRVPWTVLPHKSADVSSSADEVTLQGVPGTASVTLTNAGATAGRVEVFALTGTSKKIGKRFLPQPGDNFAVIDLGQVGVRLVGSNVQFAMSTFGIRAHPNYPAEFDIAIDADRNGTTDFVVFNLENGGFGVSGQNVVAVADVRARPAGAPAGTTGVFFFADADLNSANMIMTAPLSFLAPLKVKGSDGVEVTLPGVTASSTFNFSIFAFDNYFTGNLTDAIVNMTFTLGTPRFVGSGVPAAGIPAGGTATLTVNAVAGGAAASPSQSGLLLLFRDAGRREATGLRVSGN